MGVKMVGCLRRSPDVGISPLVNFKVNVIRALDTFRLLPNEVISLPRRVFREAFQRLAVLILTPALPRKPHRRFIEVCK